MMTPLIMMTPNEEIIYHGSRSPDAYTELRESLRNRANQLADKNDKISIVEITDSAGKFVEYCRY